MGEQRAAIFKRELDRLNRDPQQILNWMLTGKPGEQQWIPVQQLSKNGNTSRGELLVNS